MIWGHMQESPKLSVSLISQDVVPRVVMFLEVLCCSREYHAAVFESGLYLLFTTCKHHRLKLAADYDGYQPTAEI